MSNKIKCYICGTELEGDESLVDFCPYCDWIYLGWESELDLDDKDNVNRVSIRQAKENVSKGLDVHGDPLPNKKKRKRNLNV
ncbi:MAG TPA: hypothetical protein H9708_02605 [Candidatus Borkfalkia stercoripullorum]|nr:hypothetical protein [Candidatus Borkfalkia stercoripullorum]